MFNDFEVKMTEDSNWQLMYIHIFKGIFVSPSESDYKNGIKKKLNDQNTFDLEKAQGKNFE